MFPVICVLFLSVFSLAGKAPRKDPSLQPSCDTSFSSIVQVAREIELERTETLTNFLTTEDGKIRGALEAASMYQKNRKIPPFLKKEFPSVPEDKIADISWDDLSFSGKELLLEYVSKGHDFDKSRAIPGFKMKTKIRVTPETDCKFLGKSYKAGKKYEVDLEGFLLPLVEYSSKSSVPHADNLELHFRGEVPTKLRADIRDYFKLIQDSTVVGIPDEYGDVYVHEESVTKPTSDHGHIPGKIPVNFFLRLRKEGYDPELGPAILTLYHQCAELAMLIEAAKLGMGPVIMPNKDRKRPPVFNYLHSGAIPEVYDYFKALERGGNQTLGVKLKKFNVGVRGKGTYSDENLWGLELRYVGWEVSDRPGYGKISDGIKQSVDTQDFRIAAEPIANFVKENKKDLPKALSKLWFRKTADELLDDHKKSSLQSNVAQVLSHWRRKNFEPTVGEREEFSSLMPLLLMNWGEHPLVKYNTALKATVLSAQKKYLEKALTRPASHPWSKELVLDFLKDSGIEHEIDRIIKSKN